LKLVFPARFAAKFGQHPIRNKVITRNPAALNHWWIAADLNILEDRKH